MGVQIRVLAGLAALALMAGPGFAVGDEDDGSTEVTAQATATGDQVVISGDVTFGVDVYDDVFALEGDGGQTIPAELGGDIVGGTITSDPARPFELTFAMQLSSLPPVIGGVPEAAIYGWQISIDGEAVGGGSSSNLEWRRTNLTGLATSNPFVRLRTCMPNPDTGGQTCSAGNQLPGGFFPEDNEIRATVRVATGGLQTQPGATLDATELAIYHGTGALWFPGITSDTAFMETAYVIPSRVGSVRAVIVPAGAPAPAEFPVAVTPTGSGASGSYTATLSTAGLDAGSYDVVVEACWGTNCGTTRVPITVG